MASANRLINSTSPYLLQHAYNPVDWYPWGEEALQKAKNEDKPILVSIGYSACHWCHVMEHQSFENEEIAKVMNQYFVCIKVDREERPDVDQVYMDSVQAMGLQGGWPLNVFLTPQQKPFYGGTYFPPKGWFELLHSIFNAYQQNREKLEESAERFTQHLNESELAKYGIGKNPIELDDTKMDVMFNVLARRFDHTWGGIEKAPKFPMPSIWRFLNKYQYVTGNEKALEHNMFTLKKIASGGIYDHVGGGFARYSVDGEWHVPHFEKMLYDNGQLLSLYAEAYKISQDPQFKEVIRESIEWLKREMTSEEGAFYSALDADSEGEEGKFYVWSQDEVNALAGEQANLIADYFDVSPDGNWEGKNVLRRLVSDEAISQNHGISVEDLRTSIQEFKSKALAKRSERIRPGLDDKIITSWNALMLKGLVDAYFALGESEFLEIAIRNAQFIQSKLKNGKGLFRTSKNGKASIDAYLEDYTWLIDAYLALYEATFDETWLKESNELIIYCVDHFYDSAEQYFNFTSNSGEQLIAKKKEIFDNVIPASNSGMAANLYKIGSILDDEQLKTMGINMTKSMTEMIVKEPEYLSNWACNLLDLSTATAEVVVAGSDAKQLSNQLQGKFLPNVLYLFAQADSIAPLTNGKEPVNDQSTIYVCYNKTCKLPVFDVNSAVELIESRD